LMSSSSWSTSNFKHLCFKNEDEIRGSKMLHFGPPC
jgi:hypothetical protein